MARTAVIRVAVAGAALGLLGAAALADLPVVSFLAKALLALALGGILLWLLSKAYQAFLWKVGRRLAFSYFLIGVLPIPMLVLLTLVVGYLLATFLLGHLYRDAVARFQAEQVERAEEMLEAFAAHGRPAAAEEGDLAFDYYRGGQRVGGAGTAPESWPVWLTRPPAEGVGAGGLDAARYVLRGDAPTLAVAVEKGELGVTAVYAGDLAAALRQRSGLWVDLEGPEAPGHEPGVLVLQGRQVRFQPLSGDQPETASLAEEKRQFFLAEAQGQGIWDRPMLHWPQLAGPLLALDGDRVVAPQTEAQVTGTTRQVLRQLFATSAEQNAGAWLAILTVTATLLAVYAVAVLVAVAMIFGLSRAVNRLSRATAAVQQGDFSVRIPVKRRDQVGALQRSFNAMAGHLENLVATAAQKEILEKELAIARELQESLLPRNLPQGEAVEFATLFEPSAAIGGDYFDILRLEGGRLAVAIADVSGHGLSSGLRMAMLKAALFILIEEEERPEVILQRLDALVRSNQDQRFFVTATLGIVDLGTGRLELVNAGHPPTYLLRRGEVREVVLPSSPLGCLGSHYGSEVLALEPGDFVVWLSDGLIEATDAGGEAFGYEAVNRALAGEAASALEVRARLLAAVEAHTGGLPAGDDRTLVVMHYRAPARAGGEVPAAPLSASPSAA
jgi:serine phosphatase RsbU (regulator of sigma subunit)/Ca2+/Na+ antiporter